MFRSFLNGGIEIKQLSDSITQLSGVGPKKEIALNQLGIHTILDLITYFPFRYDDFKVHDLSDALDGANITLKGRVINSPIISHFGYRKTRVNFKMLVENTVVNVTFFNQPWLKKSIFADQPILIYGRFQQRTASLNGMKVMKPDQQMQMAAIYPASRGIRQKTIQDLVRTAYDEYQNEITNYIPDSIRQKYRLESAQQMIYDMHFPPNANRAFLARRTAKFGEFFLFQMRLQQMKMLHHQQKRTPFKINYNRLYQFMNKLPFELTEAQRRVIREILNSLERPYQMNRLLQGDVGSGKTIVAAIAIYATITAGYQAALMVPTEILAEQHANKLADLFAGTEVHIALLTGDTKPKARKELLAHLKSGDINLVIGTHALIQDGVDYHNLGLAVIDEQHRFGVNQRKQLRQKGDQTNVVAMTATPIPRTLAITAYGEMDVSIIDQLPNGRKRVRTEWIKSGQVRNVLPFCLQHLKNGEQMYVIAPLIEESDSMNMQNAVDTYEQFQKLFPNFKVGLLHGKMQDSEKNQIMDQFKNNEIQILISTTVIEVGVDVANATLMMILNADHFGLAQLHQLRGRVGRSDLRSTCILVADPKNEVGRKRMNVMVNSNDGFEISQKDLELRGPGDLMGRQQSGIPSFKVGDPIADLVMLDIAQEEAIQVVSEPNWESKDDNLGLVKRLDLQKMNTVD